TLLELAGRFGSLTGYGNDQSGVPLLLEVKPCCRKSSPSASDSIKPARSAPLAAATPVLPLLKEENSHVGVPLPVIGYKLKRAPSRIQAPHTLFESMATPSAMAFGSSTIQSVLPNGPFACLSSVPAANDCFSDVTTLRSSSIPSGVTLKNVR